jgi:hypothetical protein
VNLDIKIFAKSHSHLNPALLVEHARVVLRRHHTPPEALFELHARSKGRARVRFTPPDIRSIRTLQPRDFTEKGAVVMAGLLLTALEGKVITMVAEVGDRVDYFAGEKPDECRWILEVSGTETGSATDRHREKKEQLRRSRYTAYPFLMDGLVSVTRFAPSAVSTLEIVRVRRRRRRRG